MKHETVHDHIGNEYKSFDEMCLKYGIKRATVDSRLKSGWTLEKALTTPSRYKTVTDHLGNEYKYLSDMCLKYGISAHVFRRRISNGWDLEKALTTPVRSCRRDQIQDHLGNTYNSIADMCRAYMMDVSDFYRRLESGFTIEDALTQAERRNE